MGWAVCFAALHTRLGESHGLSECSQMAWVGFLAPLPLTSCVALGKLLSLSVPPFLHLFIRDHNSAHLKVGRGPGRIKWYKDCDHNPDCGVSHSREEQETGNVVFIVQLPSCV